MDERIKDGESLVEADLRKAKLKRAELEGRDLSRADLTDGDLRKANLKGATLAGANLTRADLRWADLRQANLTGADLTGADLMEANLEEADLTGANLTEANLEGASLVKAKLKDARFTGAYLRLMAMREANLEGAQLKGLDLSDLDLSGASFKGCDLSEADLSFSRLGQATFAGAHLDGANLSHTDLTDVDLGEASLKGTNLRGSKGLSEEAQARAAEAGALVGRRRVGPLFKDIKGKGKLAFAFLSLAVPLAGIVGYWLGHRPEAKVVEITDKVVRPTFFINAGSGTDKEWDGIAGFTGGEQIRIIGRVANASSREGKIYGSARSGDFTYRFRLPSGRYIVSAWFVENVFDTAGGRLFNVYVEGQKVLDNYDIFAEVGRMAAVRKRFLVEVEDGEMDMRFQSVRDSARLCGIKIVQLMLSAGSVGE